MRPAAAPPKALGEARLRPSGLVLARSSRRTPLHGDPEPRQRAGPPDLVRRRAGGYPRWSLSSAVEPLLGRATSERSTWEGSQRVSTRPACRIDRKSVV